MSRKITIPLWLSLLCLFPIQSMAQTLEYWFDDLYDLRNTTPIATSDAEQELNLDLRDNTKFPMGFHKLNMRVNTGRFPSAVSSSAVLKLAAGNISQLEYWVDDDIANRKIANSKTISGKASNDGGSTYQFFDDLDLTDVTPGYHRLYYRAVSNSKRTTSAISMTPIMVKSMYSQENTGDLTVTEQAYWFDDEEPEIISVADPKNVISYEKQPYTFDTRKLADGQHTLHMQFGNSAGVWSETESSTFTKTRVNAPMIAVNASVEEGVVTLKFNSLPYGQRYIIHRKYPSGKEYKVGDIPYFTYPAALQSTDTPAPGTYTYYVEGFYTDADGEIQRIYSGDVPVTVEKAAKTLERGSVSVQLLQNGQKPKNNCLSIVYVNGERVHDSGLAYGYFQLNNQPYGKELTIRVENSQWHYNDVTVIMNENIDKQKLTINSTEEIVDEEQPENDSFDLFLTSNIEVTPNGLEMEVKHKSNKPWTGNIIVKMISKKEKDFWDKEMSGEGHSDWYFIDIPIIHPYKGVGGVYQYMTVANMEVSLPDNKCQVFTLPFIDLPKKTKDEDYCLYVYSVKKGTEQEKELVDQYLGRGFPFELTFNPSEYVLEHGFTSYMEGYGQVLKFMKKFSAWGDPFKLAWGSVSDEFKNYLKDLEGHKWSFAELNGQVVDISIKSVGMLLNCFFTDMDKAIVEHTKSIKANEVYTIHGEMEKLYNTIKGICEASQADDNHKFFEFAKLVLGFAEKGDPVLKVYKTYLDVGEAMANAVDEIDNYMEGQWVWQRLIEGEGIYKIKVRKYSNDNGVRYFRGEDFWPQKDYKHNGQIKSVRITLIAPDGSSDGHKVESESYEPNYVGDEVIIKNVVFPEKYNTNYVGAEAWMTIEWNNKRVTHVPLLDKYFVKLENFKQSSNDPLTMTVELQSETNMNLENIANKIKIVKQKKSEWEGLWDIVN
ncbi:MAG: hypothetical protein IKI83_05335 [Prevotella sp.]|nr:hypothetical protein [Prevotella sp.]